MTSKVKVKVGAIEISFEGSEEYMKDELPKLVELLHSLAPAAVLSNQGGKDELPPSYDPSKKKLQLTTNTIASKLSVKKGPELIVAACAHLVLVKGAATFTRANILAEMKLATNYYKDTMNKNLSNSLKTLVNQNKLLETAKDTYALEASTQTQLENQLSGN